MGSARTTRTRRNNGISGNSPPPLGVHHEHGRPHAIVIPANRMSLSGMAYAGSPLSASSNGGRWGGNSRFMVGQSQSSSAPLPSWLMNDNRASNARLQHRLPSARSLSTIHPLPTCAPASAPPPPRELALALAAEGIGHASCQLDGAPSVRSVTSPKSSAASPVTPAFPCFFSFCGGGQGGQQAQQLGGDKQALLANEKQRRRESHNAV
jgi:hypothetical protein